MAICGLATLAGCRPTPEPGVLRVGLLVDIGDTHEQSVIDAATLAVRQINDGGGLMSDGHLHHIELLVEKGYTTPEEASEAARGLIHERGVSALIGPNVSRNAVRVGAVAENAQIPMISPAASHPAVTADREYAFRVTFSDQFQGQALARFARAELDAASAAVLYDIADTYSRGVAEVFRQAFEEAGGRIAAFESYTSGDTDWSQQWARIQGQNPAVVLLPNYDALIPAQANQAREVGVEAVLLGSDTWTPSAQAALPSQEGSFISQHWHPSIADENAQALAFIHAYQEMFGYTPNDLGALTYDGFGLLFAAARRAGVDPSAMQRGLAQTMDFPGVTGQITYRGSGGDPLKALIILKIEAGQVLFHQQIPPRQEK